MKALVLEEYKKLVVKDVEKPQISSNEVLIQVKACAICGSDVHGYDGSSGRRQPPVIMGHEASGVIAEVGRDVEGYHVGDRVVFNSTLYCGECYYCKSGMQNMCSTGKVFGVSCDDYVLPGAMAEYVKAPENILYHLPENISFVQAALIEPMSIALHAINRTTLIKGDTAVVFGAGTIGIFITKLLRIMLDGKIIVIDIDEEKLEYAKLNGADYTINSKNVDVIQEIYNITDGKGADLSFEAVGVSQTIRLAVECLRRNGTAVLVGNLSPQVEMPMQSVVLRELKLIGSFCCATEYEKAIELLASGEIKVDDMVSMCVQLEDGAEFFHRLYTNPKGLKKVVLLPTSL